MTWFSWDPANAEVARGGIQAFIGRVIAGLPQWIGFAGALVIGAAVYQEYKLIHADLAWRGLESVARHHVDSGLPERAREVLDAVRHDPDSTWLMRATSWHAVNDVLLAFDSWDTIDSDQLTGLRQRLERDGNRFLAQDALVLINYRLRTDNSTPSGFFQRWFGELKSPYSQAFAAREVQNSNPAWAAPRLESIGLAAERDHRLALAVLSDYWGWHAARAAMDTVRAVRLLLRAEALLHRCRELDGSTREIDVHTAMHGYYRHHHQSRDAAEELALITALRNEAETWDRPAVAIKAEATLAGALATSDDATATLTAYRNLLTMFFASHSLESSYPWLFFDTYRQFGEARLALAFADDTTRVALVRAASGFRALSATSGGSFSSDEALCEYDLARWYRSHSDSLGATAHIARGDAIARRLTGLNKVTVDEARAELMAPATNPGDLDAR